jgi:hypothetical protein
LAQAKEAPTKSTMQNPYPQITQIPQILKRHLPNSAQLRKQSLNNQCNLRNLRIYVLRVLHEALQVVVAEDAS